MGIRQYSEGDEKQILRLFEVVYKRPMSEKYWFWRFINNPNGKGIIRLMFDNEKLVGHYAVVPISLMLDGMRISAALSMSTMTHPNYGKQGIFTSLASEVYSACKRANIDIVLGFANQNSYHGLINRLGWIGLGQVIYFEKMGCKCNNGSANNGYKCERFDTFGAETDDLWRRQEGRHSVIVQRDSKYMTWRYVENPAEKYIFYWVKDKNEKLHGYMVLKIYKSEEGLIGHIIDILVTDNEEAIESLIYTAFEYFRNSSVKTIAIWAYLSRSIRDVLQQLGFVEKKWVGFDSYKWPTYLGVKVIGDEKEEMKSARKQGNWYITMGDSDVF